MKDIPFTRNNKNPKMHMNDYFTNALESYEGNYKYHYRN